MNAPTIHAMKTQHVTIYPGHSDAHAMLITLEMDLTVLVCIFKKINYFPIKQYQFCNCEKGFL